MVNVGAAEDFLPIIHSRLNVSEVSVWRNKPPVQTSEHPEVHQEKRRIKYKHAFTEIGLGYSYHSLPHPETGLFRVR